MAEEKWLLPEHVHRVCKHGVGRPGSVRVLLHGDAALNKIHGGLQVAESFAALVILRGHSTATHALISSALRTEPSKPQLQVPLRQPCASTVWPPLCSASPDAACRANKTHEFIRLQTRKQHNWIQNTNSRLKHEIKESFRSFHSTKCVSTLSHEL